MKDEEIERQAEKLLINFDDCRTKELMKDCFIDGAKMGMEHAIEWHDLRVNPNDLPKEIEICSAPVYIASKYGSTDLAQYDYRQKLWCYKYSNEHILYDVIAWCELPQFKDKE